MQSASILASQKGETGVGQSANGKRTRPACAVCLHGSGDAAHATGGYAVKGRRKGYVLVHPVGGGLEPVDDLLVVYGEEDDAGQGDGERDVVPLPHSFSWAAGEKEKREHAQVHSFLIQYLHLNMRSQSKTPFWSSLASLGVGLGVLLMARTSRPALGWPSP